MRIVSLIKYPVELKSDFGMIKINGCFGNKMVGDGVTMIEDNVWASIMKYNEKFLDRCNARGTLTWSKFHVEKTEEKEEEKPTKKTSKKSNKPKVEEVKEEAIVEEPVVNEELATENEEEVLAKAESLIEG